MIIYLKTRKSPLSPQGGTIYQALDFHLPLGEAGRAYKEKADHLGRLVPGTGIEPALPCENQILSLARLPIPPSGLKSVGCKCIYSFLYAQQIFFPEIIVFYA
jgi:hypothetical protein